MYIQRCKNPRGILHLTGNNVINIKIMKIKINEFYSRTMFPSLIMGKAKDGMFEKSITEVQAKINNTTLPLINVAKVEWTELGKNGNFHVGTYGHLGIADIDIIKSDEQFNRYSFCIMFSYVPENVKFEDALHNAIENSDWESLCKKWYIGDL